MLHDLDGGYSRGQKKYFLTAKAAWKRLYPFTVTQLSWQARFYVKNSYNFSLELFWAYQINKFISVAKYKQYF